MIDENAVEAKPTTSELTTFERDVLEMIVNRYTVSLPAETRGEFIAQISAFASNIASRAYTVGWNDCISQPSKKRGKPDTV